MWSANVSTVANTVIPCIIIHASTSEHNFLFFNCDYIIFFHSRLSTTVMSCNAAINSGDDVALRDFSDLYLKNKSTNLQSMKNWIFFVISIIFRLFSQNNMHM